MDGETIGLILVSGFVMWGAIEILAGIFKWAIRVFNAIGSFIVAALPAVVSVYISSALFDTSVAQAAVQYTATNVVLGGIGLQMFGDAQNNV